MSTALRCAQNPYIISHAVPFLNWLNTPGPAPRWSQSHRRLILLRSVDWVPPDWEPSTRLPRSRNEDRPEPPLNVVEGCAENRGRTPTPTRDLVDDAYACDRHLLGDRPHERDEFARDGGDGDVRMLAARDEPTESLAQSDLRLPADVLNRFRQSRRCGAGCARRPSRDTDTPTRLRSGRGGRDRSRSS